MVFRSIFITNNTLDMAYSMYKASRMLFPLCLLTDQMTRRNKIVPWPKSFSINWDSIRKSTGWDTQRFFEFFLIFWAHYLKSPFFVKDFNLFSDLFHFCAEIGIYTKIFHLEKCQINWPFRPFIAKNLPIIIIFCLKTIKKWSFLIMWLSDWLFISHFPILTDIFRLH